MKTKLEGNNNIHNVKSFRIIQHTSETIKYKSVTTMLQFLSVMSSVDVTYRERVYMLGVCMCVVAIPVYIRIKMYLKVLLYLKK